LGSGILHNLFLACLPLALGFLTLWLLELLEKSPFPLRGVSPSYFASVTLLFGLFASLTATEAWQRSTKANVALASEVNGLRAMLRIAEGEDRTEYLQVSSAVKSYVRNVVEKEISGAQRVNGTSPPPAALQTLYRIGVSPNAFAGNVSANTAYLNALEEVRSARLQRLELKKSHVSQQNYIILFIMGFITQISIGFSHAGNRRAIGFTVMLFSLGFSLAIYFIAAFDAQAAHGLTAGQALLKDVI